MSLAKLRLDLANDFSARMKIAKIPPITQDFYLQEFTYQLNNPIFLAPVIAKRLNAIFKCISSSDEFVRGEVDHSLLDILNHLMKVLSALLKIIELILEAIYCPQDDKERLEIALNLECTDFELLKKKKEAEEKGQPLPSNNSGSACGSTSSAPCSSDVGNSGGNCDATKDTQKECKSTNWSARECYPKSSSWCDRALNWEKTNRKKKTYERKHSSGSFQKMDKKGNELKYYTGSHKIQIEKHYGTTVGGNSSHKVDGKDEYFVRGDQNYKITGNQTTKVEKDYKLDIEGTGEILVKGKFDIISDDTILIKANSITVKANSIKLDGATEISKNLTVKGGITSVGNIKTTATVIDTKGSITGRT